jgi:hypothetical protein
MGKIFGKIPDDLEKEFRKAVIDHVGLQRGALSVALEEAIREWIASKK